MSLYFFVENGKVLLKIIYTPTFTPNAQIINETMRERTDVNRVKCKF